MAKMGILSDKNMYGSHSTANRNQGVDMGRCDLRVRVEIINKMQIKVSD